MLRIWQTDPYSGSALSQDGELNSALTFKLPPAGGVVEVQLWLRHDELNGEAIESSYGVIVQSADDFDVDESAWLEVAEDVAGVAGTYGASLSIGDVLGGEIKPFWARLTLPTTDEIGARTDIYLQVTSSSTPITQAVDLRLGDFLNTEYDHDTESVLFDVSNDRGDWYSAWIDSSQMNNLTYVDYSTVGTIIYINYRASTDGNEETATAWVGDVADLDTSLGYIQVHVEFQPNSYVGQTGLTKRIYGGLTFNTYKTTTVGATMPFSTTPADTFPAPASVKYGGYYHAATAGNHVFRVVSNDGHRLYIDGDLVSENWATSSASSTVTSTGTKNLSVGWHSFEMHYYHESGTATISTYVKPGTTVERVIALTDFAPVEQVLEVNEIVIKYSGAHTYHFDVLIYDGPDVPELIDPEDGYSTKFFRPELTVFQQNCEYVEFQFDNSNLFASAYLTTWIEECTPGTEIVTRPPDGSRPHGTWYWRARGILNSQYSAWSDWRFLTIEELIPQNEYLYINANVGLATHDSIEDPRHIYINANIGIAPHDPIVDSRFIYLNVNVDLAIGKIIYPMYDYTRPAKTEFAEDEEFLEGT